MNTPLTARATRARTAPARSLIGKKFDIKGPSLIWYYDSLSEQQKRVITKNINFLYDVSDCNDDNEKNWTILALRSVAHTKYWTFCIGKKIKGKEITITLDNYYLKGEFPLPPEEGIKISKKGHFQFGYTWFHTADIITPENFRYWQKHMIEMNRVASLRTLNPGDAWPSHPDNIAAQNIKEVARIQYRCAMFAHKQYQANMRRQEAFDKLKFEIGPVTAKISHPPSERGREAVRAERVAKLARQKCYQIQPIKRGRRIKHFNKHGLYTLLEL